MVTACNMGTTVVVTATPSQIPPVTVTTAATMTVAATQTASPSPTTAVRVQPTAYIPNCSIRTDWQIYYVVAGDTLGSIATRAGSTVTNFSKSQIGADGVSVSP